MQPLSIRELIEQRDRFQIAPEVANSPGAQPLPLREKQAIIDEVLRGMPIPNFECREEPAPDGPVYLVTKGWPQLQAILEFADNQFPTWTEQEMRQWQRQR